MDKKDYILIRIPTQKISRAVQKHIFSLGFAWSSDVRKVFHAPVDAHGKGSYLVIYNKPIRLMYGYTGGSVTNGQIRECKQNDIEIINDDCQTKIETIKEKITIRLVTWRMGG